MNDGTMEVWGLDGRCVAVQVPKWVRRETGLQDGCPPTPERSPSAPAKRRRPDWGRTLASAHWHRAGKLMAANP